MKVLISTNICTIYNRCHNMNELQEKPSHRMRNGLPARGEVKGNKKAVDNHTSMHRQKTSVADHIKFRARQCQNREKESIRCCYVRVKIFLASKPVRRVSIEGRVRVPERLLRALASPTILAAVLPALT